MKRPWWFNLVAGLLLTIGGLVASRLLEVPVGGLFVSADGRITWGGLVLALMIAGTLFWWLLVGRSESPTLLRGALAGALTALLTYPLVLGIAELLHKPPEGVGLIGRVLTVLQVSAFALATTGAFALVILTACGAFASVVMRPLYPRTAAPRGIFARLLRGLATTLAVLALVLAAGFAWLTVQPLQPGTIATARSTIPAMDYDAALSAYDAALAEGAELPLNPRCKPILLTHGSRQARAIVFLHGVTNCPAQADELAPKLFSLGYNVYVPRLPGHGMADQMTYALVPLKAEDYVEATEQAIAIGHGLGNDVEVVGLSAGGALTMWSAQFRPDVAYTVAMAPFLGPNMVPAWANHAATNLLLALPNVMFTWNPLEPLGPPEMDYAYPRVPTHALAQFMRIGEIVGDSARSTAPLAGGLGVMVNEADFAVNNALAKNIAGDWQRHGRDVDLKILPLSMRLLHDLIDPRQAEANTELAYSLLVEMLNRHSR